ncbi:MAG: ribonuclease H-like domain-containing protein [Phycisphaerae bacterium]
MQLSQDLSRRLEALDRARLQGKLTPAANVPAPQPGRLAPRPLHQLVPGRAVSSSAGSFYCINAWASTLGPAASSVLHRCRQAAAALAARPAGPAQPVGLPAVSSSAALYLDLETCGFAGSPIFLIGTAWWRRNDLRLVQLLARDYAEERAIIHYAARLLRNRAVLISFNGKSFDWPMLCERAARHRVELPASLSHCDLLHPARRVWPDLPNHRLTTLQTFICKRRPTGDIDGWQVPQAYHDFVRTGNPALVASIVKHNLWDLLTLPELLAMLLSQRPDCL